jgi:hypothetical protein
MVLVKGDRRKGSQVSPTVTSILAKGIRPDGISVWPNYKYGLLVKRDRQKGSRMECQVNLIEVRGQGIARLGSQDD